MNPSDQPHPTDISPAVPLEISAELAASVDEILQTFAEGAELETALVVESSGALVSGISSEEMMVDIISSLVAGASGAMNSLVKELGSSGNIESFHQSETRAVYLAEVMDQFILVGVSTVPVPVGLIREMARQVRPSLVDLLQEIEVPPPVVAPPKEVLSLREMALASAAEPIADIIPEPVLEEDPGIFFDDEEPAVDEAPPLEESIALEEEVVPEVIEELVPEEIPEAIEEPAIIEEPEVVEEPEPIEESEPAGIIEYIDDESPEVVIEDDAGMVVDSPFEAEDDIEVEEEAETDFLADSIFELEEEEEPEGIFEADTGPEVEPEPEPQPEPLGEEENIFEADNPDEEEGDLTSVFEIEGGDEDGEKSAFELEFDDDEDDFGEIAESLVKEEPEAEPESVIEESTPEAVEEEAEEEEAPASGPFYF